MFLMILVMALIVIVLSVMFWYTLSVIVRLRRELICLRGANAAMMDKIKAMIRIDNIADEAGHRLTRIGG